MGILTKYLIRAHVGPFVFALTALTALIFLNAVAQRLELLAGKGLTWDVIAEFLVLSLPHTIALTLPMAILVAVLYTFSELTSGNEITAMSAGGVQPIRLLLPVVGVGMVLGGVMFYFNDQVLPESNHRLKNLMSDLVRKSPTFELREQVVNEIRGQTGRTMYYLQAQTINTETNDLDDVVIYDVSDAQRHRTIYADRGTMAFSEGRTDLYLTLFDGVVHEVADDRPGDFRRDFFQTQIIPLRGVTDVLERQFGSGQRSDREMTIAMLRERIQAQHDQIADLRDRSRSRSMDAVRQTLLIPGDGDEGTDEPAASVGAAGGAPPPVPVPGTPTAGVSRAARAVSSAAESANGAARSATELPAAATDTRAATATRRIQGFRDESTRQIARQQRADMERMENHRLSAYRYEVEIHKKWAIAFACIIFVLLGAPLAMRFQRGGVGMVIALSLLIFGIYWVGLLGGERLADRGKADPFWAMWAANILFMGVAAWLLAGIGKAGSTTRGGGLEETIWVLKRRVRKALGRGVEPDGFDAAELDGLGGAGAASDPGGRDREEVGAGVGVR